MYFLWHGSECRVGLHSLPLSTQMGNVCPFAGQRCSAAHCSGSRLCLLSCCLLSCKSCTQVLLHVLLRQDAAPGSGRALRGALLRGLRPPPRVLVRNCSSGAERHPRLRSCSIRAAPTGGLHPQKATSQGLHAQQLHGMGAEESCCESRGCRGGSVRTFITALPERPSSLVPQNPTVLGEPLGCGMP